MRVDTHLAAGDEVPPYYDSLLAKVIAHGDDARAGDRDDARARSRAARIEGVATTIPLHLAVLASAEFRRGDYDTASIPGWGAALKA